MTTINNIILRGLVGCCITAVLTSCSDWLEIKPQNVITKDEFWNEQADVDNMIAGLYATMQSQNVMERMMVWGEFRSDNITSNENTNKSVSLLNVLQENLTASNSYTTWDQFYYIINQANTIIDQAPAVAAKDPAFRQSQLMADIAECSALRDLCYFYLIRTFRNVPYTTTPYYDDDQEMKLPALPFETVLDSLIADLEQVKDYAVTTWPQTSATTALNQTGRITRTAIYAMLCDLYLWKKDYAKCVAYADLVINDKKAQYEEKAYGISNLSRFNGFPLTSDYMQGSGDFGNAYNDIFSTGSSTESILELVYMTDDALPKNGAVSLMFGNGTTSKGYVSPSDFVGETADSKLSTGNAYYVKDARYYENLWRSDIVGKYSYRGVDVSKATPQTANASGMRFAEGKVYSNWILYRLTDVMLMKAEALACLMTDGNELEEQDEQRLEEAFTLVNAVNKRSMMQADSELSDTLQMNAYKSKDKMLDLVMRERQRELMFEGKRYYDLVRRSRRDGNTDYMKQAIAAKFSTGAENKFSRMDYIYWPYNVDEIKVNASLTQNPAFGSGESSDVKRN